MSFKTINGKQIKSFAIEDRHIKDKLSEEVLAIDWAKAKSHFHNGCAFKPMVDTSIIVFDELGVVNLKANTLKEGIDQLDVYLNGILQAETYQYTIIESSGYLIGISFTPIVLRTTDIIILKWVVYKT